MAFRGFCRGAGTVWILQNPGSKLSYPDGVSRGIPECRRHLTSFTFRWPAKPLVERRISKHLKYLRGKKKKKEKKIPEGREGSQGKRKEFLGISCLKSAKELIGMRPCVTF